MLEQALPEKRRELVEEDHPRLSLRRQCQLLQINRSSIYYKKKALAIDTDVTIFNEIRDIWEQYPFYGYRRITKELVAKGYQVNHKRVQRLMQLGGISAIYPGLSTSRRNKLHAAYPYLLKDTKITKPNQAWMVDITYLRLEGGFVYLVALIDVYSRYIVGFQISTTLEAAFCLNALEEALEIGRPEMINSDQGCQFTSEEWTHFLKDRGIKISMTGKGRCLDNAYIERFWRSVKREEFY